jgi:hypothetical protein
MTEEVLEAPAEVTPAAPAAPAAPEVKAAAPAAPEVAPAEPALPDWATLREKAVHEVLGPPKDTDTADVRQERDKMLKLAGRYTSMGAALKALRDAQVKLTSGELKAALPKNATPEQVAEWRKSNGIPEAPDKYELPADVELNDVEKGMASKVIAAMHEQNATPAQVQAALKAWKAEQVALQQQLQDMDASDATAARDALRDSWGGEYQANIDGMANWLKTGGAEVADALANARGPDGKKLLSNPVVAQFLAQQAKEMGYVGGVTLPSGADMAQGIDAEIKAIEAKQYLPDGRRNKEYWADEKVQERYRQLLDARDRRK